MGDHAWINDHANRAIADVSNGGGDARAVAPASDISSGQDVYLRRARKLKSVVMCATQTDPPLFNNTLLSPVKGQRGADSSAFGGRAGDGQVAAEPGHPFAHRAQPQMAGEIAACVESHAIVRDC